jgi:uncharacterized protein (TIRG00374 family)
MNARLRRGLLLTGIGLVLVYAWMLVVADETRLAETLAHSDLRLLPLPLVATLLSYLTMSLSYEGIATAAGCRVSSLDMLRITFVANTANYVLPTGGLSGFALRLVMLSKKGVPGGRAVLVSFTQTVLTNVMLMVFIVYGLVHLILSGRLTTAAIIALSVLVTALSLFLGGCMLMVYRKGLRSRLLSAASDVALRLIDRFGKREALETRVSRFFLHLAEGMEFFAERPRAMVAPLAWIFLDWLFTVAVLYTACIAVGADVTYGEAAIAFSVGIVVAIASFVPGGVGILEVTLAGMFATVGVPTEQSVLAIFVFRICFYVIPVLLSLVLARGAFREADVAVVEEMLR